MSPPIDPADRPSLLRRLFTMVTGTAVRTVVVAAVLAILFLAIRWTGWLSSPVLSSQLVSGGSVPEGIVYYLPLTVIDVHVKARINDCRVMEVSAAAPANPQLKKKMFVADILVEPTVTMRTEPDPDAVYMIEAKSLGGWLWSSDFTVGLTRGLLSAVNARSASIGIAAPTTTVRSEGIQSAPESGPVAAAQAAELDEYTACGTGIAVQLRRREGLVEVLKSKPSDAVTRILESDVAAIDKALTKEIRGHLVPRLAQPASLVLKVDPADMFEQAGSELRKVLRSNSFQVIVSGGGKTFAAVAGKDIHGVVYRTSGSATLSLCRESCRIENGQLSPHARLYSPPQQISIAQFGVDAAVPIERTLFANRTMQITFAADGTLGGIISSDQPVPPTDILKRGELPPAPEKKEKKGGNSPLPENASTP